MPQQQKSNFNLTYATHATKRGLAFFGFALTAFLVFWFASTAFVRYWIAMNPEPPPPPSAGFGVLPMLQFPSQNVSSLPKEFVLETPTGKLPTFSDRAIVFFMPKNSPSLLDAEKASRFATTYDFVFEPEILDAKTYRWQRTQPLLTTLEYNIQDKVFSYSTDIANRPELLLEAELPTRFDAILEVKQFLGRSMKLDPDIATASGTFTYVKSVGSALVEAVSAADANFIIVNIDRFPIEGRYQTYGENPEKSSIHALVGNIKGAEKVIQIEYYHYPVDYSIIHTYPLRPIRQAWDLLQAGEGFIARPSGSDTAVIREITLGYYDSREPQQYLQPIYVFSGDNGFLGYISAIDPTFINTSKPAQ